MHSRGLQQSDEVEQPEPLPQQPAQVPQDPHWQLPWQVRVC
jgi:hypothetical protein